MNPRFLRLSERALRDLDSRAAVLLRERGPEFAKQYCDLLLVWLEQAAFSGAQLGTQVGEQKHLRAFGYRRQATVLADFTEDQMRIVRIYFRGQDWQSDFRKP